MKVNSKKNVSPASVKKATKIQATPEKGGKFRSFLNKLRGK